MRVRGSITLRPLGSVQAIYSLRGFGLLLVRCGQETQENQIYKYVLFRSLLEMCYVFFASVSYVFSLSVWLRSQHLLRCLFGLASAVWHGCMHGLCGGRVGSSIVVLYISCVFSRSETKCEIECEMMIRRTLLWWLVVRVPSILRHAFVSQHCSSVSYLSFRMCGL